MLADGVAPSRPTVRIAAARHVWWPRLRELAEFHELLYFLVWRDVRVRYRQTAVGIAWALLQPMLAMGLFAVIFGRLPQMRTGSAPYALFVFCGLVPWQLFVFGLGAGANSLTGNERLLTKVYFPRMILPAAAVLAGVVDFTFALAVLIGIILWWGVWPGSALSLLPLFVVLGIGAALAVGIGLSALTVRYRDVRHTLPFLTQLWMFATPIVYPADIVPARWRGILALNPLTAVVEGFRWCLLGDPAPSSRTLVTAVAVVVAGLALALSYFAHIERSMADEI